LSRSRDIRRPGRPILSRNLGARLGITAIETDAFALSESEAPTYVGGIDTAKLGAEIAGATAARLHVIVEGICLRDTLAKAAVTAKVFVYVKRITAAGLWADDPENELDGNWTDRQSIDYHARFAARASGPDLPPTRRMIRCATPERRGQSSRTECWGDVDDVPGLLLLHIRLRRGDTISTPSTP